MSCNFDQDFCGFDVNANFLRYTGKSPSFSSGPSADRTTGKISLIFLLKINFN